MQENAWENEDEEVSRRSDLSNNSNLTPTFPPPLATWAKIAKGGIFCWVRSFQVRIICMCSLFLRFAAGSYSLGVELRVDGASQSEDDLALLNLESTSLAMGGGGGSTFAPQDVALVLETPRYLEFCLRETFLSGWASISLVNCPDHHIF
jgi:hypothetical protein